MLSLGEIVSDDLDENRFLYSNCYFDRINLKSIEASENIFDFSSIDNLRKELSGRFHLQDSLLLISEDEPVDLFDSSTNLYASLISLPMWNENIIKDSSTYIAIRKEIKKLINNMIDSNVARLYNAFEYCDYVLLCDASKVSVGEYLKLINDIRDLTVVCKKTVIKAVKNVITVYGYSRNNAEIDSSVQGEICLTVRISFKTPRDAEKFKIILNNKSFLNESVFFSRVFGQYDYVICWKNILYERFNAISFVINDNVDLLLNWRMYVGSPEDINTLVEPKNDDLSERDLSELGKITLKNYGFLNQLPIESHLARVISDIDCSLKYLLSKGMSQYYVLSFYESFYSFVSYLQRLSNEYINNPKTDDDKKNNKIISEKIYDMFRTYFGVINALNECTTHSSKQFLQIAPCQMMYFDAPPKLIAFYTAIINRIVRTLNCDIKDKYTFLITPDFKKDIFVESLTEDRTVGEEHNLLIIHMSEESMYNIVSSLKIVLHEIFHHIGQNKDLRYKRAKSYLKCCLASIFVSCLPDDLISNMNGNNKYAFLKALVDELFLLIFTDRKTFFPDEWFKNSGIKYTIEEAIYYSDYLNNTFIEYINYCFLNRSEALDIIYQALNNLWEREFVIPCVDFWEIKNMSSEDYSVLREFTLKNYSMQIHDALLLWIMNNEDSYSVIQYVFRECFADAKMLLLICNNENATDVYRDTLGTPKTHEDTIRKAVIIKRFACTDFDKQDEKLYEETLTNENNLKDNMNNLFYLYLRDETENYLSNVTDTTATRYTSIKSRISNLFKILNDNNVTEFIDKMDEYIFDYRKLLIDNEDKW